MGRTSHRFVISLGGSLIAPPGGVAVDFLNEIRQLLLRRTKAGDRFVLVCGGGQPARDYMAAAAALRPSVTDRELDLVGIAATKLNAHLVQAALGPLAHAAVISDPRVNLRVQAPVIVAAGWKPGCSTDKDAVLLAERFEAGTVINLSNIKYVYDRDPWKHDTAEPIERMSWSEFGKAFGTKWMPGLNTPFDPVAGQLAKRSGIRAIITDGRNLKNLERILDDRSFTGTVLG